MCNYIIWYTAWCTLYNLLPICAYKFTSVQSLKQTNEINVNELKKNTGKQWRRFVIIHDNSFRVCTCKRDPHTAEIDLMFPLFYHKFCFLTFWICRVNHSFLWQWWSLCIKQMFSSVYRLLFPKWPQLNYTHYFSLSNVIIEEHLLLNHTT